MCRGNGPPEGLRRDAVVPLGRDGFIDKVEASLGAEFDHVYFQRTGPTQEAAIESFQKGAVPEFS